MSKFLLTAASAALVAAGLSAQTKVIHPAQSAKAVGNYNNYFPFAVSSNAIYRSCRYQQIMDLPANAKGKLSSIAFRSAVTHATRGAPPAFSATLEVKVSTSQIAASAMSTSWASNEGKDATTVIAKKVIKFAKFPLLPKFPQPFFFKMPFDKNKVLAFAGGKSLLLDLHQFDNDLYNATTRQYNYFYSDAINYLYGYGIQTHEGRPCFSSNTGTFLPFYGYTYANIRTYGTVGKGNLQVYGYNYNGPKNGVSLHVLSAGKMPVGIPIAGGCSLYVNLAKVLLVTPSATNASGYARFPAYVSGKPTSYLIDTPFQQAWAGSYLYGQGFAFDAKANSAGLISTQLNVVDLPRYYKPTGYGMSSIYRTNYTGQTTGYARKGLGNITELTFN